MSRKEPSAGRPARRGQCPDRTGHADDRSHETGGTGSGASQGSAARESRDTHCGSKGYATAATSIFRETSRSDEE